MADHESDERLDLDLARVACAQLSLTEIRTFSRSRCTAGKISLFENMCEAEEDMCEAEGDVDRG